MFSGYANEINSGEADGTTYYSNFCLHMLQLILYNLRGVYEALLSRPAAKNY